MMDRPFAWKGNIGDWLSAKGISRCSNRTGSLNTSATNGLYQIR
jgi:hypothetical protein